MPQLVQRPHSGPPAPSAPFDDAALLERFEPALAEALGECIDPFAPSPMREQVRWHFGLGAPDASRCGKRLRPRLVMRIALEEGARLDEALDAALAVELVHNASLVHDDIEDADRQRHGRATVWDRYGLAHGINAGDCITAISYLTLLRNRGGLPPERLAAQVRILQGAHLAMCGGQAYDLAFESASHVTMEAYLAMADGKAAALFGAACELGAVCAGAADGRARAYREIGLVYGRAFQIYDDVKGTWALSEATGKPSGSDIGRRKWTFPIVWALAQPPSTARSAIAARYAREGRLTSDDVAAIGDALDAMGARYASEAACIALVHEAEAIAGTHGLDAGGTLRGIFTGALAASTAA